MRAMCRIGIELEPEMHQLLGELEVAFGKRTKVEVIRMAISLLGEVNKAKQEGNMFAIVKGGKVLRELIVL